MSCHSFVITGFQLEGGKSVKAGAWARAEPKLAGSLTHSPGLRFTKPKLLKAGSKP
jgi:hypothetical protein